MLRIVNLEEFHRLLLRVPALVDDLESRTADAPGAVRDWLVEVEGALENNRMPLAGNIAGLRARLDSASRGRRTQRRCYHRLCYQTKGPIRSRCRSTEGRRRHHRCGARSGRRPDRRSRPPRSPVGSRCTGEGPGEWTASQRRSCRHNPGALGGGSLRTGDRAGSCPLLSLVGPNDAVIVLDRAITRDIWTSR